MVAKLVWLKGFLPLCSHILVSLRSTMEHLGLYRVPCSLQGKEQPLNVCKHGDDKIRIEYSEYISLN